MAVSRTSSAPWCSAIPSEKTEFFEIVGADGKVESDQQYRGFRWWNKGDGSRTSNNHFTRDVLRVDGTRAYVGYGVDSPCSGAL